MSSHAPGPWCVDDPNSHLVAELVGGVYEYIANCNPVEFSATNRVDREVEANTHLISAAPELYEALQLARETIAAFPKSMGYDITHLRAIDAALAKARGEQ